VTEPLGRLSEVIVQYARGQPSARAHEGAR
jgi:two-component system chemotaxis response regulator CheB